jgi:hypothetical protein
MPRPSSLTEARARAWSIEGGYRTVRSAHEAVSSAASVNVVSRYNPRRVDAVGDCPQTITPARTRSVERGYRAAFGAYEAVINVARVKIGARDNER